MGSLYRSEKMCLAQLYLQSETAFACISELGELGLAQFRDLNPSVNAFQRKFVNEVRRCDEMERKLRFLERELKKDNILIHDNGDAPLAPLPREMIELETTFEKLEKDMNEVNTNQEQLKRNFLELTELKHILRKTQNFFEEAVLFRDQHDIDVGDDESTQALLMPDNRGPYTKLGFVAGVIQRERITVFERVLWRACRGNVFLRYTEIETPFEDPSSSQCVHKSVFVIFFQGEQLKSRVKKICEGLHASLYPCPETPQERREISIQVMTRIEDLQTVLNQTEDHRRLLLSQVALNIRVWLIKIRKIKAIYHTLNLFNVNIAEKCLIGECWCPLDDLEQIRFALRRGTELSGSSAPSIVQQMRTDMSPPTYHKTNKFTSGFQALIDAFGIANYREINPALFTIITFPFLFAIMFGDLGHGLLMFLFGLYCVINERRFSVKTDNDIWEVMFGGRYLILMMGLFSMYTGFLYNDCFSRSINIFGSSWNASAQKFGNYLLEVEMVELDPVKAGVFRRYPAEPFNNASVGNPYPYGMDPIWQSAFNKISFQNSYKMKAAVIVGFCQMLFGLILALKNHLYFKNYLKLYCEWIPQMLFLWSIIGYLCILILYKWAAWTSANSGTAPSLLIGLINMFMFVPPNIDAGEYPLYGGKSKAQYGLQIFIVVIAILCVPWMLFAKPYVLYKRSQKKGFGGGVTKQYGSVRVSSDEVADDEAIIHHDQLASSGSESNLYEAEHEPFELSEVMIHQVIHTIEFCLNCISHTASYLRLWALSLAHAELSEVLWNMVMQSGLTIRGFGGAVFTFLVFWAFSTLTVVILLLMEGLSAFLHALRLHWVEFQSKFYGGEGHPFTPFSFQRIVEGNSDD